MKVDMIFFTKVKNKHDIFLTKYKTGHNIFIYRR